MSKVVEDIVEDREKRKAFLADFIKALRMYCRFLEKLAEHY